MALLDGDLKAVFGSVFSPLLLDGTLSKVTLVPDGYGGGAETVETSACKVMVEDYSAFTRAQAGIPATDVKLIVLQQGVTITPDTDSKIKVHAQGVVPEQIYSIKAIKADPASASWTFQGRPTS